MARVPESIRPRTANETLWILRRIVGKPERALYQPDESEHAFLFQCPRQATVHQCFGLVARIGNEVKDVAHLAQLGSEASDLAVRKSPGVPVPRRRQVVRQKLMRKNFMDGISPKLVI